MTDKELVAFLQWALPRMGMRWRGFKRVRRQVRRRIARRLADLHLSDLASYRMLLEREPLEWDVLDALCRVTVSRFLRNRGVFAFLFETVLPELSAHARARGETTLRAWSAGCASGEEAYTLVIGWRLGGYPSRDLLPLEVLGTDVDEHLLERARAAIYPRSSLRELPEAWRREAFERAGELFRLKARLRRGVAFERGDVRHRLPDGPFDVILCRNLVCTYHDDDTQRRVLAGLAARLVPGGALVLGHHETLASGAHELTAWDEARRVFRALVPGPRLRRVP